MPDFIYSGLFWRGFSWFGGFVLFWRVVWFFGLFFFFVLCGFFVFSFFESLIHLSHTVLGRRMGHLITMVQLGSSFSFTSATDFLYNHLKLSTALLPA